MSTIVGSPPVARPPSPTDDISSIRTNMPAPPLPEPLPPDPAARLKNFVIVGVAAVLGYILWR